MGFWIIADLDEIVDLLPLESVGLIFDPVEIEIDVDVVLTGPFACVLRVNLASPTVAHYYIYRQCIRQNLGKIPG